MTNDEQYFERALGRIGIAMLVLGVGGEIVAAAWGGWRWGAGFALGAVASWLNFRWLKQIVYSLGAKGRGRKRTAVLAGLRYLLLGGAAYVTLRFSRISLPAALAGLFIAAGAVIFEILLELLNARSA